jgi:hypothetical protein
MSDNEKSAGPFGGLTPAEAGRKSWETRRQRKAEAAESNGTGPVVGVTDTDAIIRALRDKAMRGDVPAARELRDWIEVRKEDEALRRDKRLLELLTPQQRACIEAELREEPITPDNALAAWCSTSQ